MKPEFRIDLSEGAESPLEALYILSHLDPSKGFHISKDLRPPLGIYNTSIFRVCDKVRKCCEKLEVYFKTSIKPDVLRTKDVLRQDMIDYLELALYAAAEHVDDIKLIAKGFYFDDKKYKSSNSASKLGSEIKKHKALISASINAVKHHQARIRVYSLEIQHASIGHCLHGYFIEGVHNGQVGPNKIFHDDTRQVFSITSLLWEIICFILISSRHLKKFLIDITGVQPIKDQTESKMFSNTVVSAARLPLYSFDDNHPFSETRIIICGDGNETKLLDSNIYGSIIRKWKDSNDMKFLGDIANYEGDGVSKTFRIVKPVTLNLQHWS